MVRKWSLLLPLACMVLLLGLDTGTADETFRIHKTGPRSKDDPASHHRFHPRPPPVMTVRPGDTVFMETRDAFDGQIPRPSTERDVIPTFAGGPLDLNLVHPLTGPVAIQGAEPGDLLEVHIVDIIPDTFAYTINVPGFGFLRSEIPGPQIIRWNIVGSAATSPDLPGVRIYADPSMGTAGIMFSVPKTEEGFRRGERPAAGG